MIIIIGASGFIGSRLFSHFLQNNIAVIGTCHSKHSEQLRAFDITSQDLSELTDELQNVTHVIITAAMSNVDACARAPELSHKINVEGTLKLIKQCVENNITPIFFSSDYVFNGTSGLHNETSTTDANTYYGRQKKAVEDHLLQQTYPWLIFRISKTYDLSEHPQSFVGNLIQDLASSEKLKLAHDQIFSPAHVYDVIKAIDIAIKSNLTGLYNAGGPEALSRLEVGKICKEVLQINGGEIIPCSITDFSFVDSKPLNTSIDSQYLYRATGHQFSSLRDALTAKLPASQD